MFPSSKQKFRELSSRLLVAFAWCAARLPLRAQFALGRAIGDMALRAASDRRHVAETNVRLCFPQLDDRARDALVRANFRATGIGIVETAIAWFREPARYVDRLSVTGLEHLLKAERLGRGVLLIGAHFVTLDFAGALLSLVADIDVVYRPNENRVLERATRRGRNRYFGGVIERDDMRTLLNRLKSGRVVWYAADQDYGRRVSVFAPFFGVAAATIATTSRLAAFNGSPSIFFGHFRDEATMTWQLEFSAPIEGYPSGDAIADATRINAVIERAVAKHPEQYLWMHRRFKTRPEGEDRPY